MSTGFLFPGQGSQKLGMLADIPEMYMERLENVTGYRLVDKEENYQDTVFIQLALLTKAVFYLDEMEKNGIQPDIAAGHSIGAFCAAVACRSLRFENAAELVYHRAVLMKEAYPSGYAMGVVVGVTRSEAEEIVAKTFDPDLAFPVQWNQMMDLAKELGMDLTIEFPPGNTLTKLIHTKFGVDKGIRTINLDQHGIDDATFLYQKWR